MSTKAERGEESGGDVVGAVPVPPPAAVASPGAAPAAPTDATATSNAATTADDAAATSARKATDAFDSERDDAATAATTAATSAAASTAPTAAATVEATDPAMGSSGDGDGHGSNEPGGDLPSGIGSSSSRRDYSNGRSAVDRAGGVAPASEKADVYPDADSLCADKAGADAGRAPAGAGYGPSKADGDSGVAIGAAAEAEAPCPTDDDDDDDDDDGARSSAADASFAASPASAASNPNRTGSAASAAPAGAGDGISSAGDGISSAVDGTPPPSSSYPSNQATTSQQPAAPAEVQQLLSTPSILSTSARRTASVGTSTGTRATSGATTSLPGAYAITPSPLASSSSLASPLASAASSAGAAALAGLERPAPPELRRQTNVADWEGGDGGEGLREGGDGDGSQQQPVRVHGGSGNITRGVDPSEVLRFQGGSADDDDDDDEGAYHAPEAYVVEEDDSERVVLPAVSATAVVVVNDGILLEEGEGGGSGDGFEAGGGRGDAGGGGGDGDGGRGLSTKGRRGKGFSSGCWMERRHLVLLVGAVVILVAGIAAVVGVLASRGGGGKDGGDYGGGSPSSSGEASTSSSTTTSTPTSPSPPPPVDACPGSKLVASDGQPDSKFGYAVAISDGTALVGAYRSDNRIEEDGTSSASTLEDSGSAYIFVLDRNTGQWTEEAKLDAGDDDAASGDLFGVRVAIDGDLAVVSADAKDEEAGAVYVFRRRRTESGPKWRREAKIVAEDGGPGAEFGDNVAVSGETVVISATCPNNCANSTGRGVYVYEPSPTEEDGLSSSRSWVLQAHLLPADYDYSNPNRFGRGLAYRGGRLVVGADRDDTNTGAAYVYQRQMRPTGELHWVEEAKIVADDGEWNHYFGFNVDIDASGDDTVVVGAWKDGTVLVPGEPTTTQIGSAYVYRRTGIFWTQEAKIVAGDGDVKDRFGCDVALDDDGRTLLVGAYFDDDRRGSAYLYRRNPTGGRWEQRAKLRARDAVANDRFGLEVALDGSFLALIGEAGDGDQGYVSGAVHAIDLANEECFKKYEIETGQI